MGDEEWNALMSSTHDAASRAIFDLETIGHLAQLQTQTQTDTATVGVPGAFKDADHHSKLACDLS